MHVESITVSSKNRRQVLDVTDSVAEVLPPAATGTATVCSAHTTCGIALNEAEDRLLGDVETFLSEVVADSGWGHDEIDDNADSHLRALLVGASETVPVVDGELKLGTWQSVLLVECDGPRTRTIRVAVTE